MNRTRTATALVPLLAAGGLALAACGGGASPTAARSTSTTAPTTTTTAPSPSSTSTSTTTTAPPSSSTTVSATSTTAAATTSTTAGGSPGGSPGGRCHTAQLSAGRTSTGAATGHVGQVITFRNTSSTPCTLEGYPGLGMLDAQGHAIATKVSRGTSYIVHAQKPALVTVAPGGKASFALGYTDATGYSGMHCPSSSSLEVTPPNAYHHLVISDHLSPYGPCGKITVSPVYPGSGRQPT